MIKYAPGEIPSQTPNPRTELYSPTPQLRDTGSIVYEGPLTEEDAAIETHLDADIEASHFPSEESITASIHKELPELLDAASWHRQYEQDVETAINEKRRLSVIFIDLDYLKELNDSLGHVRGDEVIAAVPKVLASVLRTSARTDTEAERLGDKIGIGESDPSLVLGVDVPGVAGRIGGDEFTVEAETDEKGAQIIVNRIREAFNTYLQLDGNEDIRSLGAMNQGVNLSIGAATLKPGMTASELLKAADNACYVDKQSHFPEFKWRHSVAMNLSKFILDKVGLRPRDVAKVEQAIILQREAKKAKKTDRA